MSNAHPVESSKVVLQSMAPPKCFDSMLRSEVKRIKFYQSHVENVRACEAASVQLGTTCTAVPLRLCIDTKALKAVVVVGTFQGTILQQPLTVENVTDVVCFRQLGFCKVGCSFYSEGKPRGEG
jgi:hypothetical protein